MNNDFEQIQKLLRLKRYETPGEDFVEAFVTRFHERQRAELLRQSARGLLWERMNTFFEDWFAPAPRWTTAAATAAFALVAVWGTLGWVSDAPQTEPQLAFGASEPATLPIVPTLNVDSQLIQKAEQAQQREIESILLSRHFAGDELAVHQNDEPFGAMSRAALPVLFEPNSFRY